MRIYSEKGKGKGGTGEWGGGWGGGVGGQLSNLLL